MSAVTERAAVVEKGPRFWREGDAVMFQFVIDGGNIIGPRPANARDRSEHATAYRAFSSADMAECEALAAEAPVSATPLYEGQEPLPAATETVDQVSGQPEGDAPRRKARTTVKA